MYALCQVTFNKLFPIVKETGHVPDEVFLEHGIPADLDINGTEVIKTAGIRNEQCQR
jgi:hypothetical protein